jgi:GNAT superfamily N-acetyltransferase
MTFELSEGLLQKILFAMENQKEKSALDAKNADVVAFSGTPDEDTIFALPEWTSADGFALLEEFAFNLHSPSASQALKDVIRSGRGVFKNFKQVIREYPDVEKKWHLFKNKKMSARVYQWYNALREMWGLEVLDSEIEDTDELVLSDFVFQPYNAQTEKKMILQSIDKVSAASCKENDAEDIANTICAINRYHFEFGKKETGIICKSVSGDFVGCVTGSFASEEEKSVFVITALFVLEEFRGLGIAKSLLERFFSDLKAKGIQKVIITDAIASKNMKGIFTMFGFKNVGSCYLTDLKSE